MVELLGIVIAVLCFAFAVALIALLEPSLMSGGDIFGLVVALLVFAYLLYVLFRGERL